MAFAELAGSLEHCMAQVGIPVTRLSVEIGSHEGELRSVRELRVELTETLWLRSRRFRISLRPANYDEPSLSLVLDDLEPVLLVVYHGTSPQARETLRAVVERTLAEEPSDPRRHRHWLRPIVGAMYAGTWVLIWTRIPPAHLHWKVSTSIARLLVAVAIVFNFIVGIHWTSLILQSSFPPLERLPDSSESLWDRRRTWVQVSVGLWLTLVLGLLALPNHW